MRILLLMVLAGAEFLVALSPVSAQGNADPARSKIRVAGSVVSQSGASIPRATVRLQSFAGQKGQAPANYVETTDASGNFVFEDVAPGRYRLWADRTGFLIQGYSAGGSRFSDTAELNLTAGNETSGLVVKMVAQAVVTGRIISPEGDAIEGAQVTILRRGFVGGRRELIPVAGTSSTDDQGSFRITGLVAGRYYLSASDPRVALLSETVRRQTGPEPEVPVTTYYPNALDPNGAAALSLTAGSEARADIRIRKARVYSIRGKVIDSGGRPVINPNLTITSKDDSALNLTNRRNPANAEGEFEFRNLIPGTYVIRALPGSAVPALSGRLEVTVNRSSIDKALLTVDPGAEVSGSFSLEDGDITTLFSASSRNPASGQERGGPQVTLIDSEGIGRIMRNVQVNEDGQFRLQSVAQARYFVHVTGLPDNVYVKSISAGGQDITHSLLVVTGGTTALLNILLSPHAADIAGTVRNSNGESISGVMVTLWPKTPNLGDDTEGLRRVFSDQSGDFRFAGLAPGDYSLAAWEEIEKGLGESLEFCARFSGNATSASLSEGAHAKADVTLIPREAIAAEASKIP